MKAAVSAELRKTFSTRMWWIMALVLVGYLAFISAIIGFAMTQPQPGQPPQPGLQVATSIYSSVNTVGYVFPLLIGSLAMTGEFRHQTITASLLAEPRRWVFLVAKLIAMVPIGLAYGVLAVLSTVIGGGTALAIAGDGAYLGDPEAQQVLALGIVSVALWSLIGVAVGSLLTNQVAAIVVILAFTQFVEPIARVVFTAVSALNGAGKFLPGAAAEGLVGASLFSGFGGSDVELLPQWAGAVVLLGYMLAFALAGYWFSLRRDIS